MPKGEKIRPKQKWISYRYHFEKIELEFLFVKILLLSLFVKSWSLVGRRLNYGKRGSF
jgi:hypothetical protein